MLWRSLTPFLTVPVAASWLRQPQSSARHPWRRQGCVLQPPQGAPGRKMRRPLLQLSLLCSFMALLEGIWARVQEAESFSRGVCKP